MHLNLGYNKISHVEPGDFEWAEDLEILLLRNNILTKLKAETFKGAGASPVYNFGYESILSEMIAISHNASMI